MIAICGNIPCNQENEETQTPIMLHKPTCMHATSKRGKHSTALAQSAERYKLTELHAPSNNSKHNTLLPQEDGEAETRQ
jgi:hypothetical protein